MKKAVKWIIRIVVILLIVLIAAVVGGIFFLDHIAKGAIENIGPIVAGVPFQVEKISISPLRGRVEIGNFIMGNPADKGYRTEHAVKLGDVAFEIDVASVINAVTSDAEYSKIIIREVRLRNITMNYETPLTFTGSNIQDILDNVNKAAEKDAAERKKLSEAKAEEPKVEEVKTEAPEAEEAEETQTAEKKKDIRIQLDKLIIDNVQMRVAVKDTDVVLPLIVELPDMGPLGTSEEGITPLSLTQELSAGVYEGVYNSVIKSKDEIVKACAKVGEETVKAVKEMGKNLESTGKDLKESFKNGGKDLDKNLDKAGEELKKVGDGLKKLF